MNSKFVDLENVLSVDLSVYRLSFQKKITALKLFRQISGFIAFTVTVKTVKSIFLPPAELFTEY